MTSSDRINPGSLGGQVRELAEEVETGLIRLHDYYVHTLAAWNLLKDAVEEGRHQDILNRLTGTSISLPNLAARSELYLKEELLESCLGRLVSLLEHWVFGLLRLWLIAYPEGIPEKDKKPVKLTDILAASDKDEILRGVVEWELLGVAYKRPSEWFKYLRGRVNLAHPTDDQVEGITEIKATRDLLTHNQGLVNQAYLDKAGRLARFELGQRAEVPDPYFHRCWELIHDVVGSMTIEALEKAGP